MKGVHTLALCVRCMHPLAGLPSASSPHHSVPPSLQPGPVPFSPSGLNQTPGGGSTGGPNNGGQFRFGTVSWVKVVHDPPTIRFTIEAAFRRGYTAMNFRGSGADGNLIVQPPPFPLPRILLLPG